MADTQLTCPSQDDGRIIGRGFLENIFMRVSAAVEIPVDGETEWIKSYGRTQEEKIKIEAGHETCP